MVKSGKDQEQYEEIIIKLKGELRSFLSQCNILGESCFAAKK